jgi:4-phospho-D-threonate 3-dehydrogenase / 4-phospho-D-erythronate 3-dehydrogenase
MKELPLIAVTLGDPAGIGPEVVLRAVEEEEVRRTMRLLLLGPESLRPDSIPAIPALESTPEGGLSWLATETRGSWEVGRAQASGGHAALGALRAGASLAMEGRVDALVTAPVSKEALHRAGEKVEGQTTLLGRWADAPDVQMLALAGKLRVLLLTRHMPLVEAISRLTVDRVLGHLLLLDRSMRRFGCDAPRLALAGLNPHAGEGGMFGREEIEILEPALERAREQGLEVTGPEPPDTVFFRASRGDFDAVLALYHDQGFIPVKLLGAENGLTVLLGLPYLRVSPAHGTAFDIAGKGVARPENLLAALRQAAQWASARSDHSV